MGQKINPNLFRLKKNDKCKYLETKYSDFSVYSRRNEEIRAFIFRFFKIYQMTVYNCKLYYKNKSLYISICYCFNSFHNFFKYKKRKRSVKNLSQINISKVIVDKECAHFFNLRNVFHSKTKILLKKFFESLKSYTKNNLKIILILKDLKFIKKQIILNRKIKVVVKKVIGSLRKYRKEKFFKNGLNILLNCVLNRKSSDLLAHFISIQLKNLKYHNYFIRFLVSTLKLLKNKNIFIFQAIKIEIKGRLSGQSRAKTKILTISKRISTLTMSSNINYSEKISYTSNGTIGIKVWIQD